MSEQEDAVNDLGANGVLTGLGWAWDSARLQTMGAFEPDTGHNQGWVGYNAFTVLTDRLDRVFSLGRFSVGPSQDPALGADVLAQGLLPGEFDRMPHLEPGLVARDDLNRSPGWRSLGWRILLQSYGGLDIDRIPWSKKSWTKQRVALQPAPEQLSFDFGDLPMAVDVLDDLSGLPSSDTPIVTLVGAYSIDAVTGNSAFYIGRPSFNHGGGAAWYWRVQVDNAGPADGGGRVIPHPGGSPYSPVPDADVRLRPWSQRAEDDDDDEAGT